MNGSERITMDPQICHGKPTVRGLRYTVESIRNRLDDRQRVLAEDDARRYESLSEQERDSIWNQEADSYRSRE